MSRAWARALDVADDLAAYVLTIVGILISNYLPLLKETGAIDVRLDVWRVGIAAIVALLVVTRQEALDPADKEGSRKGRRRNFSLRMANALSHGIAWDQIMQLAS